MHCIFYEPTYRVVSFSIALKFMLARAFFFKNSIEKCNVSIFIRCTAGIRYLGGKCLTDHGDDVPPGLLDTPERALQKSLKWSPPHERPPPLKHRRGKIKKRSRSFFAKSLPARRATLSHRKNKLTTIARTVPLTCNVSSSQTPEC